MSGRAVRRALQRQREAELLQNADSALSSEDEAPPPPKQSLFALLNAADDDQDNDEESTPEEDNAPPSPPPEESKPAPKKKKNKKKKKGKKPAAAVEEEDGEEDEIDRALKQLKLNVPARREETAEGEKELRLADVLKVDSRNLDAASEMRRLFGRAALRGGDDAGEGGRARGAGRGGRGGGRGLVGGRKNTFVQPKEEWPNAGSGGLGMEVVFPDEKKGGKAEKAEKAEGEYWKGEFDDEKAEDPRVTEFAFVHSRAYQDVQRQFMMCVASMDPNRLITLLQHNPYHVTTLLQVSEIFQHQRDFTVAGDMLERALFSLGRSLHSSFAQKLAEGTARISFRRPENRELYLAGWRYIKNLSQRGTWRTAEEFGRLLFAVNPLGDPYELCLLLDFLALKAHQPERFLAMAEHPALRKKFEHLPNIAFSSALAHLQLDNTQLAEEYLSKAAVRFPWIPTLLYQEVGIDATLPPALWGKQLPDDNPRQALLAKLYVARTADLWKIPNAKALLEDVCQRIYNLPKKSPLADAQKEIDLNTARHVVLSEINELITMIPRHITNRPSTSFDPLPPDDTILSYDANPPEMQPSPMSGINDANTFATFLRSILPWFRVDGPEPEGQLPVVAGRQLERGDIQRLRGELEMAGVDIDELVREQEREEREMREGRVEERAEQERNAEAEGEGERP